MRRAKIAVVCKGPDSLKLIIFLPYFSLNTSVLLTITGHPILQLEPDDFKCYVFDPVTMNGGIGALMLSIMTSIICFIHWFEIKILMFDKLGIHLWDRTATDILSMNYHAYIMYHEDDERWVEQKLLPNLDNNYSIYVPAREPRTHSIKAEDRADKFSKCHRVIVVLSQKFIDNDELMVQFFHAHQHENSPSRKRFLILIMLDDNIDFRDHHIFKSYVFVKYFVPVCERKNQLHGCCGGVCLLPNTLCCVCFLQRWRYGRSVRQLDDTELGIESDELTYETPLPTPSEAFWRRLRYWLPVVSQTEMT